MKVLIKAGVCRKFSVDDKIRKQWRRFEEESRVFVSQSSCRVVLSLQAGSEHATVQVWFREVCTPIGFVRFTCVTLCELWRLLHCTCLQKFIHWGECWPFCWNIFENRLCVCLWAACLHASSTEVLSGDNEGRNSSPRCRRMSLVETGNFRALWGCDDKQKYIFWNMFCNERKTGKFVVWEHREGGENTEPSTRISEHAFNVLHSCVDLKRSVWPKPSYKSDVRPKIWV